MAKPKDRLMIPELQPGEQLTIQRNVNGHNVLMFVVVQEPCSIGPDRIVLTATMVTWGESPYSDGRVENQRQAIDRLLDHLMKHCTDLNCEHRGEAS